MNQDCSESIKTFAESVRKRRKELKMTQTELSNACGFSLRTCVNIESGRSKSLPHSPTLEAVSKVLGKSVDELCGSPEGSFDRTSGPVIKKRHHPLRGNRKNFLPILKNITESEIESITFDELSGLLIYLESEKTVPSKELLRELIKFMRATSQ